MKTICMKVDTKLFRDIKIRIAERGKTLQEYMNDLISRDLYPIPREELINTLSETKEILEQTLSQVNLAMENIESQLSDAYEFDDGNTGFTPTM